MNSVHKNYLNTTILETDENALLDITDFESIEDHNHCQQLIQLMGKSGKRKHTLNSNSNQYLTTIANDDDSGFCGSNLSVPTNKMVRIDEELLLWKVLMKEVNEPTIVANNIQLNNKVSTMKTQNTNLSSKSKNGKYELKILSQPEEQHRARYLTEGSRGAIKDKSGLGHPIVKLCGYNKSSVKIQCFIGHDKHLGQSHMFYQASKITGKNSTKCSTKKVEGTTIITMDASPDNDMQVTVDCVGILKERNVDVEQKLTQIKSRSEKNELVSIPSKKRSTRCRLVFRTQIPETNEILQTVSTPILCTQPLGTPEISKKSIFECSVNGGVELFIIGKNFLKDSKVIWKTNDWSKVVEPDKEFLHPTHLVCMVPPYGGPNLKTRNSIDVSLFVRSGGKYSDPHKFTFVNMERDLEIDNIIDYLYEMNGMYGMCGQFVVSPSKVKVNTMPMISESAQITCAPATNQFLMSNLEKPIILTMIGSTAPVTAMAENSMDSQLMTQSSLHSNTSQMSLLNSEPISFRRSNSSPHSLISFIDEDTNMSSSFMIHSNSPTLQNDLQLNQTFDLSNGLNFNNKRTQIIENNDNSIDAKMFKTEMPLVVNNSSSDVNSTVQSVTETVTQYLPLNSFNEIPSNTVVMDNTNQMTDILTLPINSINCETFAQTLPSTQMTSINSDQSLTIVDSMVSLPAIENKSNSIETQGFKPLIAENPILTSTASTAPVTQANNISALSEMSDAELLCFINPATFDQI